MIEILLIEDNPGDARFFQEMFKEVSLSTRLTILNDGEQGLAFFQRDGQLVHTPLPDIVFLDLNLPQVSGHEILGTLKQHPTLRTLPVCVFLTSEHDLGRQRIEQMGLEVACYLLGGRGATCIYPASPLTVSLSCRAVYRSGAGGGRASILVARMLLID